MDVTALKRRARRFLRIFGTLRLAEFLFAAVVLSVWGGFFEEKSPSLNIEPYSLGALFRALAGSLFVGVVYYVIFMYLFFSVAVFLVVEIWIGLKPKNISLVNALPYTAHGLVLIREAAEPTAPLVMWALIVVFNFYIPKRLEKKLFGPPES